MAGLDLTNLSPADAVAALRSYPRRFRAVLVPLAEDPTVADRLARVGPDGRSALDITADVARTIVLLDGALAQALVHDDAVLHPAVTDAAARHWDGAPADLDGTLVLLDDGCAAMADRADQFRSREMLFFANLLSPLLLLPFAAVVMETSGCPVSLSWPSCEVVVGEGSCRCIESDGLTAPRASVEMRILDDVDLGASASLALALTADVDPEQWAALGRFAARTYVPASEQSRVSGAGAGLSDND